MKKYNLITFDVRGTLLTFNRSIGEIYSDVARNFGIRTDPFVVNDNFNKHLHQMNRQHPNFGLYTGIGWKNWWRMLVMKSFNCNVNESSKNMEKLSNHLIERFSKKHEWKIIDGSIEFLECLENKGVNKGIISNFDPRLHKILEDIGIRKYFTFVVTSYETGFLKPDENIFKEAQKEYTNLGNKFDKSTCVHIGDSFKNDYCGAKNAGWDAVLIGSSRERNSAESSIPIYKNLYELKEQLIKAY